MYIFYWLVPKSTDTRSETEWGSLQSLLQATNISNVVLCGIKCEAQPNTPHWYSHMLFGFSVAKLLYVQCAQRLCSPVSVWYSLRLHVELWLRHGRSLKRCCVVCARLQPSLPVLYTLSSQATHEAVHLLCRMLVFDPVSRSLTRAVVCMMFCWWMKVSHLK